VDDRITGPLPGSGFAIVSRSGGLGLGIWRRKVDERWSLRTLTAQKVDLPYTNLGFAYMVDADLYRVRFPYWLLILFSFMLTTGPWKRQLPRRFTLRTLLIAMTLLAIVLGLAVYALRK
jgi:hypothetical protein